METSVDSISLIYGNAKITFLNIFFRSNKILPDSGAICHTHSYYELHLSCVKNLTLNTKNGDVSLGTNELIIIPPSTPHMSINYESIDSDMTCVIALSVTKLPSGENFYSSFISALDRNALIPIPFHKSMTKDLQLLKNTELYRTMLGQCRLQAIASGFVCDLLYLLPDREELLCASKKEVSVLIDTMITYPTTTLEDIADATNYSKRHVSRLIKSYYGMSLSEIRKKLKSEINHKEKD
ncbi:MAG: AraC family transcriptional regulator [Clostridia bacterium]|nr:AraC family transcriptional regulator [Clostridia bacterium]